MKTRGEVLIAPGLTLMGDKEGYYFIFQVKGRVSSKLFIGEKNQQGIRTAAAWAKDMLEND